MVDTSKIIGFHKRIVFSKTPLKGCLRYKNKFQIFPANLKDMPKSKRQKHFPIVLELFLDEKDIVEHNEPFFETLEELGMRTASISTKEDEILMLLTLFSNHLFFKYDGLKGSWGLPLFDDDSNEEIDSRSSSWNMEMFHWPILPDELIIDGFTDIQLNQVNLIEHKKYFSFDPNLDFDSKKEISFPETIFQGLSSYYSKNVTSIGHLQSAISHIRESIEFFHNKKTMSLIAAFTAIETMVNMEYKDFKPTVCDCCDQLVFKVSERYREFLFKYIGKSQKNKSKFNKFYSLRSKIIHAGMKLKSENLWSNLPENEKSNEFISRIEIIQLAKFSIFNWLLLNPNTK
ncbi:MAG: HEPN domain-containing protein [Vicingaceae bacterium]